MKLLVKAIHVNLLETRQEDETSVLKYILIQYNVSL